MCISRTTVCLKHTHVISKQKIFNNFHTKKWCSLHISRTTNNYLYLITQLVRGQLTVHIFRALFCVQVCRHNPTIIRAQTLSWGLSFCLTNQSIKLEMEQRGYFFDIGIKYWPVVRTTSSSSGLQLIEVSPLSTLPTHSNCGTYILWGPSLALALT